MTTIEDRLKTARKNAGFSQKSLAERLGITARTLQRHEKDAGSLTVNIATNISHLCDVDLIWLLSGEEGVSKSSNITVIEHQDLVKGFKDPKRGLRINQRIIYIQDTNDALFDKADALIEGVYEAAKTIGEASEKKTSQQNEPSTKKRSNDR